MKALITQRIERDAKLHATHPRVHVIINFQPQFRIFFCLTRTSIASPAILRRKAAQTERTTAHDTNTSHVHSCRLNLGSFH